MSGLVFDPTNPDVLYAAKNKNWVFRMVRQGDLWVSDTANGWSDGKQIFFPGSASTISPTPRASRSAPTARSTSRPSGTTPATRSP